LGKKKRLSISAKAPVDATSGGIPITARASEGAKTTENKTRVLGVQFYTCVSAKEDYIARIE
jgi:hypothetical protein